MKDARPCCLSLPDRSLVHFQCRASVVFIIIVIICLFYFLFVLAGSLYIANREILVWVRIARWQDRNVPCLSDWT